jgi:hypothetical protein
LNTYRYDSWDYIYPVDSAEIIKNTVFVRGPVAAVFVLYDDFYDYDSGIYVHSYGDFVGYHAAVVVGWNDSEEYFIVKNSWGPWGEEGYFRIAYSEVLSPKIRFGYQLFYYGDAYFAYPANAAINPDPVEGLAPLTVDMNSLTTGTIDVYLWDFGDGLTSNEENPTHTFEAPNVYEINLTAVKVEAEDASSSL